MRNYWAGWWKCQNRRLYTNSVHWLQSLKSPRQIKPHKNRITPSILTPNFENDIGYVVKKWIVYKSLGNGEWLWAFCYYVLGTLGIWYQVLGTKVWNFAIIRNPKVGTWDGGLGTMLQLPSTRNTKQRNKLLVDGCRFCWLHPTNHEHETWNKLLVDCCRLLVYILQIMNTKPENKLLVDGCWLHPTNHEHETWNKLLVDGWWLLVTSYKSWTRHETQETRNTNPETWNQ